MRWRLPNKLKYRSARVSDRRTRRSLTGQLRPSMPQKTHVGNGRSQGVADVTRRHNRGEETPERLKD